MSSSGAPSTSVRRTNLKTRKVESAVTSPFLCLGTAKRGKIGEPCKATSFDEAVELWGGFADNDEATLLLAAWCFFGMAGTGTFYGSRVVHMSDLTDPASYATAAKGSVTIPTASGAIGGVVTTANSAPFSLADGDQLDVSINGGADQPCVCNGSSGYVVDTTNYGALTDQSGKNLIVSIKGGVPQTINFGAATAIDHLITQINSGLTGGTASNDGGHLQITDDLKGKTAAVALVGGTCDLSWNSPVPGAGHVNDLDSISGAELKALFETDVTGSTAIVNSDGTVSLCTTATGSGQSIQIKASSTADSKLGLDNVVHSGSTGSQDTLKTEAKHPGDTETVIKVLEASSRRPEEFNMEVWEGGSRTRYFANLSMEPGSERYVESVINVDSEYVISAEDKEAGGTAIQRRPVNGSYTFAGGNNGLTGISASDYIGNVAGPTGVYQFDDIKEGRLLAAPGMTDSVTQKGLIQYAEVHREGSMFVIASIPSGKTCAQAEDYVKSDAALANYSEYAGIYYPYVTIPNPAPNVFGSKATITVAPDAVVAGRMVKNDNMYADGSGAYQSPAGETHGTLEFVAGLEADPNGRERHEVNQYNKRSRCTDARVNIIHADGGPLRIDDGLTLKSDASGAVFPEIKQSRTAIKNGWELKDSSGWILHLKGTPADIKSVENWGRKYLDAEMLKGAYASKVREEAYEFTASQTPAHIRNDGGLCAKVGLNIPGTIRKFFIEIGNAVTGA